MSTRRSARLKEKKTETSDEGKREGEEGREKTREEEDCDDFQPPSTALKRVLGKRSHRPITASKRETNQAEGEEKEGEKESNVSPPPKKRKKVSEPKRKVFHSPPPSDPSASAMTHIGAHVSIAGGFVSLFAPFSKPSDRKKKKKILQGDRKGLRDGGNSFRPLHLFQSQVYPPLHQHFIP